MTPILQDVKIVNQIVSTTDYILWASALFWFLALTFATLWLIRFLNKLAKGVKEKELVKILEKILSDAANNSQSISELEKQVEGIKADEVSHIQKVGLIRFNPFSEVGGDHSFSMALLDLDDTGVIVTSIHTRDRTRVYAKVVRKGKSTAELSSEEKKALSEAQRKK